jgi:hypothetical protein
MQYSTIDPNKLIYVAGVEALKEYNEGKRVRVSNSRVKLTVSPFLPPFVPVEILGADVSGLITSVSWDKSISAPAGSFSVTMVNDKAKIKKIGLGFPLANIWDQFGASLLDIFKPMTMAKLDIDGYHIMTGFVESVIKNTNAEGQETVTVNYSELGELYNRQIGNLYQNFDLLSDDKKSFIFGDPNKTMHTAITLKQMTLAQAFSILTNSFLSSTLNYGVLGFPPYFKWSDNGTLPFRFISAPAPLGGIANNSFLNSTPADFAITPNDFGMTFWDWVTRICPSPWMECFTESGGRTINTGRVSDVSSQGTDVSSIFNNSTINIPKFNITPMLPGLCYLVVRSTPFDNPITGYNPYQYVNYNASNGVLDLIISGDFVVVTDYDVISKSLGNSQENQYTAFKVNSSKGSNTNVISGFGRPIFSRGGFLPIMPGGQRTYGNRYMEKDINVTSLNNTGFVGQILNDKTNTIINPTNPYFNTYVASTYLQAWYRNASKFREGSITTRMIPYARPGMMFLYLDPKNGKSDDQRENGTYYIDSLAGNWTYGETDSMQFSLTRGTPLPFDATSLSLLLLDWELTSYPGINNGLVDG